MGEKNTKKQNKMGIKKKKHLLGGLAKAVLLEGRRAFEEADQALRFRGSRHLRETLCLVLERRLPTTTTTTSWRGKQRGGQISS